MTDLTSLFGGKAFDATNHSSETVTPTATPTPTPTARYVWETEPTPIISPTPTSIPPTINPEPSKPIDFNLYRDNKEAKGRGRPKRFTGPGWDGLTAHEYRNKARSVMAKDRYARRKNNKENAHRIELAPSQLATTPVPESDWSDETKLAYSNYLTADNDYEKNIKDFLAYIQLLWLKAEKARHEYVAKAASELTFERLYE